MSSDGFEYEHSCWDPKGTFRFLLFPDMCLFFFIFRHANNEIDGELCPDRVKPEETLVEARSGSDVQIDRQI